MLSRFRSSLRHIEAWIAASVSIFVALFLPPSPAHAFTWNDELCIGFAACNTANMGNAGYEFEYLTVDHWGMYGGHNCTNYAAYRLIKNGVDASYLRGQGNAFQWGPVAADHGFPPDKSPRPGDIAWFSESSGVSTGGFGHVAYVESVNSANGTVRVSEDNSGGDFDWRDYQIADVTGFIHFGDGGSVSNRPLIWGLTTTGAVRRYKGSGQWEGIAGSPVGRSISVGPTGVVTVVGASNNNVYRYDGAGRWSILGKGFKDIGSGAI